ncbi:MAG: AAA family ATPase [Saprospiraceae bacterium]|nr:AAA family ATPase [Saprospiraceae bacterium]
MKVKSLTLNNIRSFELTTKLNFSNGINIIIGQNNVGKSTILKSILNLQITTFGKIDELIGSEDNSYFLIDIDPENIELFTGAKNFNSISIVCRPPNFELRILSGEKDRPQTATHVSRIQNEEPYNQIYYFKSNRKVVTLNKQIDLQYSKQITGDFTNITAKVDRLNTPQNLLFNTFISACEKVLGFQISTKQINGGKTLSYYVDNDNQIPIESMGDGVLQAIGIIADIVIAKDKVFLIEEVENDLHPNAIKELLNVIYDSSINNNNQFFISTHSNIVLSHLGSHLETKIFEVTQSENSNNIKNLRLSNIIQIKDDFNERKRILTDLGYNLIDFTNYSGWIFFEESSAESIVNKFLIPWFVPDLNSIRTYSSAGSGRLYNNFKEFVRTFVFIYLDKAYNNKAWVIIDGGEKEKIIINKFRKHYDKNGFSKNNFIQLSKHDFEQYYPSRFKADADKVIDMPKDTEDEIELRKQSKSELLNSVISWAGTNYEEAKKEFESSASEIIEILRDISAELHAKRKVKK